MEYSYHYVICFCDTDDENFASLFESESDGPWVKKKEERETVGTTQYLLDNSVKQDYTTYKACLTTLKLSCRKKRMVSLVHSRSSTWYGWSMIQTVSGVNHPGYRF